MSHFLICLCHKCEHAYAYVYAYAYVTSVNQPIPSVINVPQGNSSVFVRWRYKITGNLNVFSNVATKFKYETSQYSSHKYESLSNDELLFFVLSLKPMSKVIRSVVTLQFSNITIMSRN